MQHATFCHSNQHCEISLSVFRVKNPEKNANCENFFSKYEIFLWKKQA